LLLPSCALLPLGSDDDSAESGWSTIRSVNASGSTTEWSVADRGGGKALVSLTASRAVGLSVAGTMVLSPSAFLPEQAEYQRALLQYLAQTDRPNCQILSGAQTTRFQYEFRYDCVGTATIEPRRSR
jgi:hypothetical protein